MTPDPQSTIRLEPVHRSGYLAEIFSSQWKGGVIFHYVVQRAGSKEILHFGQEVSEQRARELVNDILESLVARSSSQTA
jgi:hypothetical protein